MTDLKVLEGCQIRTRTPAEAEPVAHVTRHAAERYLERVEHGAGPFGPADLRHAGAQLMELFGARAPVGAERVPEGLFAGAWPMHAGRVHVLVFDGRIITVLPLGAAAPGCTCKGCARARRRDVARYRRSIDMATREGLRLEYEQKRPTHRRQVVRHERDAGRAGHGAALRAELARA